MNKLDLTGRIITFTIVITYTMNRIQYSLLLIFCTFLLIQCKEDKKPQAQDSASINITGIDAIDLLSAEISKTPMDASLYYERAKAYMDNNGNEYAVKDAERAVELDSLNPNYYHLLSDAYMDFRQSKLSLITMMKVGTMYPERTATQLKLAETQYILLQYDYAVSTLNKILKYDPLNAEAYFMLGMVFNEHEEDKKKAKNAFLTAVENDPDLVDAWLLLGQNAMAENDPLAKRYYQNALNAEPENVRALHSLAFYLQNHGDVAGAQDLYKKIHVLDKNYLQANLNSGILYIEQDSLDKAFEQFNIITQNNPANHVGYYYRGVVHELKGNLEKALADYQNSMNIKPDYEKAVTATAALEEALKK